MSVPKYDCVVKANFLPATKIIRGAGLTTARRLVPDTWKGNSPSFARRCSSTPKKTVLKLTEPRLVSGAVILFDGYFSYPNWDKHKFKAFQE
jgi:hypothetical protein